MLRGVGHSSYCAQGWTCGDPERWPSRGITHQIANTTTNYYYYCYYYYYYAYHYYYYHYYAYYYDL